MNSRIFGATLVGLLQLVVTGIAYGETCIASGSDRQQSAKNFSQQCTGQITDCDLHHNKWYCSNGNINKLSIETWLRATNTADNNQTAVISSKPCLDPDGDGWGWNGTSSCLIGANNATSTTSHQFNGPVLQSNTCVDADGDGWGWNGHSSCLATTGGQNHTTHRSVHSDGDCSGDYHPTDITDLILVTGQSNVTGAETLVSASLDRFGKVTEFHHPDKPHPRVFAWTVDSQNNNNGTGWKVAALNQNWHDSVPGAGGMASNSFAFHFAKKVAESSACRVVGLVVVSEGGRGISHWDEQATGWIEVTRHVNDAMSEIGRTNIDGILWHQGESDWITDGTCYTGSLCRNNLPDYYPQKLYSRLADPNVANHIGQNALLDRLRRQDWFSYGKPFIAGETVKAPVNVHLNKLNSDFDQWTACVRGDAQSGIGIREDDPHKNHYNAAGLRELGERYASEYLNMTGRK